MSTAVDLEVVAGNVERFPTQAVRHVVAGLRQAILVHARRDTGGDLILSGARGSGRLAVAELVDEGSIVHGTVIPGPRKALGPWRWLEDGTRPRIQGRGHHPGTKAKRTLTAAATRALPDLVRDIDDDWQEVLR